jgi:hypothetical protein
MFRSRKTSSLFAVLFTVSTFGYLSQLYAEGSVSAGMVKEALTAAQKEARDKLKKVAQQAAKQSKQHMATAPKEVKHSAQSAPPIKNNPRPPPSPPGTEFQLLPAALSSLKTSKEQYIQYIESTFPRALSQDVSVANRGWKQAMARIWNPDVPDARALRAMDYGISHNTIIPFASGGEADIFRLKGDPTKVLKRWHEARIAAFSPSSKGMVVYADAISKAGTIGEHIRVARVYEIGNDYIIREFAPNSIELARALKGGDEGAIKALEGLKSKLSLIEALDPMLQKLQTKLQTKGDVSGNLHWDPDTQKILLIDTLGF